MGQTTIELIEEHVERSEWNGFRFKRATADDSEVVHDLICNHYFPDEPISQLQGASDDHKDDFRKLWTSFLDDNLTFIAFHVETGRPAGVRVSFEHHKDKDWGVYDLKAPETLRLLCAVKEVDEQSKLYEKYNIDTYADLLLTCVHIDFRKRGLVGEMYRRSIALARARGFVLAKACFSSPFSRKAAQNQGFEQVAKVELRTLKDDNDQPVFVGATDQMVTQAIYIL